MRTLMVAVALAALAASPQPAAAGAKDRPNFGYTADGRGVPNIVKYNAKHTRGQGVGKRNDPKTVACRRRAIAAGVKAQGGKQAMHAFIVRCKRGLN